MDETALTVSDVAKRLKLSPDTVLALIHAGRLAASNVGLGAHRPRWRITPEALDLFVTGRSAPKPAVRRRKRHTAVTEFF